MSSVKPCMRAIYQALRVNPDIPCNCYISVIRRHPEIMCKCAVCAYENCDCDCDCDDRSRWEAIPPVGFEIVSVENGSLSSEVDHHQGREIDIVRAESVESFYSLQNAVSNSKFKRLRRLFSSFCSGSRALATSWRFWCCLFVIAVVLGIGSTFLMFSTTRTGIDQMEIISSTCITTDFPSTIISSSTSIKTTTADDFPTPVEH